MTVHGVYKRNVRDALAHLNNSDPVSPDTWHRRTQDRFDVTDSAGDTGHAALASGVITLVPIYLAAGDVITDLSFISGATAATTPTNWWYELRTPTGAIAKQTADQLTAAWAAKTIKTLALAGGAYTVPLEGIYEVGIMMAAATPVSLLGCVTVPAVVTGERALVRRLGTGLTAPAGSPATTGTATVTDLFAPYAVAR